MNNNTISAIIAQGESEDSFDSQGFLREQLSRGADTRKCPQPFDQGHRSG
jgi:hypothetical protein